MPRDEVLAVARREGAHSYDAPGAEYTHRDGKCSFDVLIEDFNLTGDPGLARLAQIVHAADVSEDIDSSPEGRGLSAIAHASRYCTAQRTTRRLNWRRPCTTPSRVVPKSDPMRGPTFVERRGWVSLWIFGLPGFASVT